MKPRTILLGIGLLVVVIFCAAMKGHYEQAEEVEHQKNIASMKEVSQAGAKEHYAHLFR